MSAKLARRQENMPSRSVLNAGGCDIAEIWIMLHSNTKRDLSLFPEIANELHKGREGLTIANPFLHTAE